jgi:tetratricopeptide (TPR) repeat protein
MCEALEISYTPPTPSTFRKHFSTFTLWTSFFVIAWAISSLIVRILGATVFTAAWGGLIIASVFSVFITYSLLAILGAAVIAYWGCRDTTYDRALKLNRTARILNPIVGTMSHFYTSLEGEILFRAGRYGEAERAFNTSLNSNRWMDKLASDRHELVTLGVIQTSCGNQQQAKAYFDQALKAGVHTRSFYVAMSQWYLMETNHTEQALEFLDKAHQHPATGLMQKMPEYIPSIIQAMYAWTYAQQGLTIQAKSMLAAATEPTGENFLPGKAELYYWVARVEHQLGNLDCTRRYLQEAITLDPNGHGGKIAYNFLKQLS